MNHIHIKFIYFHVYVYTNCYKFVWLAPIFFFFLFCFRGMMFATTIREMPKACCACCGAYVNPRVYPWKLKSLAGCSFDQNRPPTPKSSFCANRFSSTLHSRLFTSRSSMILSLTHFPRPYFKRSLTNSILQYQLLWQFKERTFSIVSCWNYRIYEYFHFTISIIMLIYTDKNFSFIFMSWIYLCFYVYWILFKKKVLIMYIILRWFIEIETKTFYFFYMCINRFNAFRCLYDSDWGKTDYFTTSSHKTVINKPHREYIDIISDIFFLLYSIYIRTEKNNNESLYCI